MPQNGMVTRPCPIIFPFFCMTQMFTLLLLLKVKVKQSSALSVYRDCYVIGMWDDSLRTPHLREKQVNLNLDF